MYQFEAIGQVSSCYSEKFGVPRQPGLVSAATARFTPHPPYNREEMVRGLEGYSHIWIVFVFHEAVSEGWRPMVRPPRLGGQKRVGLFASRSPHRPNPVGMSVVRLERVVVESGTFYLDLSGVDLLDGTPVLDIKPYVSYSDSITRAEDGFAGEAMVEQKVVISPEVMAFCNDYRKSTGRDIEALIVQTLESDPRPASQRTVGREYGVLLWDVNVRWRVEEWGFLVLSCGRNVGRGLRG
ncbi:tRNA (N6-threonylcarbamoyladenosine(37)-N6)-methyltransferase TrmO [Desulfopila sp. IMCC35008]|uniref:tRNA (N6-threonylcarbamoyladenosine(37)-N6)-methyltransferase TrmO n=1 Tax=Desulfopila sp. IMCC35008 TaxID=2653858 RepID=UPI0013D5A6EF|nr:tRNA (N6-threonylcarbamoyladenosine(37)-N6)-methyltransferase TrmO [Desulfopila sp. IMCC35008]